MAVLNDKILVNDWHVVGHVSALDATEIMSVRVLGIDVVVWRTGDGCVLAWKDLCIHRGVRLSLGEIQNENSLMCPYHGWTYNAEGRCISIPAHPDQQPPEKARVEAYHAKVERDLIWVCLGTPPDYTAPFPEWDDQTYRRILCGPYVFKAHGPRIVENFLDVGHFPFVHENTLGTRERPEIAPYEVVTDAEGVTASQIRIFQPNPDGTGIGKEVEYTYRVFRPLTAYFRKEATTQGFAIMLMVTPVEETISHAWMWMLMNHSYDVPEQELRAFQDHVAGEDIPIVESQRPELLPLDLQAELHLRSDKTAIAYRKWLRELGLTFGTA
ncbi:MAG: aromatic ring-hydroxylating dioxygenase subunit alpha [Anaerolineae bacterium]|nr:aromatic ring-hydroxylating dioxygenase subunit alpha [Anaerolineae bacterium]